MTTTVVDSELKVHVKPRPRYSCEKCLSNFSSILDLSEHERVDHNGSSKQS
jgi:hypothetical protein